MQDSDQDYHNFSTPSSHRLPTLSGTQAIRNAVHNSRPLTSGLASLDKILSPSSSTGISQNAATTAGGFRRGMVTEIFGPPGVGKTTIALQTAMNTILHDKAKITWIDTSSPLMPSRMQQLLDGKLQGNSATKDADQNDNQEDQIAHLAQHFDYFDITSLPKLLAMLLHPLAGFPVEGTSLVVIEDLSNLVLSSLPRRVHQQSSTSMANQTTPTQIRNEYAYKQAMSRRTQVISSLASGLQAFAAAKNVVVLVTCKASINLKGGRQAFLRPALSSQQWNTYIGTTIALCRDFWPSKSSRLCEEENIVSAPSEHERRGLRYAQVVKLAGREVSKSVIGFVIEEGGLRELTSLTDSSSPPVLPVTTLNVLGSDDLLAERSSQTDENMLENEQDKVLSDMDIGDPPLPQAQLPKRKAIEIADSDDEDITHTLMVADDVQKPDLELPNPSQLEGRALQHEFPTFQTAKKLRIYEKSIKNGIADEEAQHAHPPANGVTDQMSFDENEAETPIPAFSQAAAEMSDPLTPSDDDGQSP